MQEEFINEEIIEENYIYGPQDIWIQEGDTELFRLGPFYTNNAPIKIPESVGYTDDDGVTAIINPAYLPSETGYIFITTNDGQAMIQVIVNVIPIELVGQTEYFITEDYQGLLGPIKANYGTISIKSKDQKVNLSPDSYGYFKIESEFKSGTYTYDAFSDKNNKFLGTISIHVEPKPKWTYYIKLDGNSNLIGYRSSGDNNYSPLDDWQLLTTEGSTEKFSIDGVEKPNIWHVTSRCAVPLYAYSEEIGIYRRSDSDIEQEVALAEAQNKIKLVTVQERVSALEAAVLEVVLSGAISSSSD